MICTTTIFLIPPILLPILMFNFCVGIYEKFADAFTKAVKNMQVGNGLTEGTVQVLFPTLALIFFLLCTSFTKLFPVFCLLL